MNIKEAVYYERMNIYYDNKNKIINAGWYKKIMEDAAVVVLRHLPEVEAIPMVETESIIAVKMALQIGCGDIAAARLLDAACAAKYAQHREGWNSAPKEEKIVYRNLEEAPEGSWQSKIVRISEGTRCALLEARASLLKIVAPGTIFKSDDGDKEYAKDFQFEDSASRSLAEWYLEARKETPLAFHIDGDILYYGNFYPALEKVARRCDEARIAVDKAAEKAKDKLFSDACKTIPELKKGKTLYDMLFKKTAAELMDEYVNAVKNMEMAQKALDEMVMSC